MVRSVQCYQKSLSASTSTRGWEKHEDTCLQVISTSLTLLDTVQRVTGVQHLQLSSSIRMSVSSAVKLISQGQTNIHTGDISDPVKISLDNLSSELSLLTDRIAKLREG